MLARALEARGVRVVYSPLRSRAVRAAVKALQLAGAGRLRFRRCDEPVFFQINHPWSNGVYPYHLRHPVITYSFDCWPNVYDQWENFFVHVRPNVAFISAKGSVLELSRRCPGIAFNWLPEAISPAEFSPCRSLLARNIDVLELGRRHRRYHEKIKAAVAARSMRHVYSTFGGQGDFPRDQIIQMYSDAKVVICFPRSITNPEQAGTVETTTLRYFEAIASGCVLLGHCPQELYDLFGYNPVIEADLDDPVRQLTEIIGNIASFEVITAKNLACLLDVWTVDHQADVISDALRQLAAHDD